MIVSLNIRINLISYWFVIHFGSSTDTTQRSFEKFDCDRWMIYLIDTFV